MLDAPVRSSPLSPLGPTAQEGSRYEKVMPKLMIQLGDLVEAALLPLRMSPQATPAEIILNRQRTPYEA